MLIVVAGGSCFCLSWQRGLLLLLIVAAGFLLSIILVIVAVVALLLLIVAAGLLLFLIVAAGALGFAWQRVLLLSYPGYRGSGGLFPFLTVAVGALASSYRGSGDSCFFLSLQRGLSGAVSLVRQNKVVVNFCSKCGPRSLRP